MEEGKVLLLGAGGHAKVVIDILEQEEKWQIEGLVDNSLGSKENTNFGYPVIGSDQDLPTLFDKGITYAFVAVGSIDSEGNEKRERLFQLLRDNRFNLLNAIHDQSVIGSRTKLGVGIMVGANSCINPGSEIGNNVIVNSGSIVEHDCKLGNHVHIAPGAKLAGSVRVGDKAYVGLGANIIQGVNVGANSTIGAGAVVINDVPGDTTVTGVPAEPINGG